MCNFGMPRDFEDIISGQMHFCSLAYPVQIRLIGTVQIRIRRTEGKFTNVKPTKLNIKEQPLSAYSGIVIIHLGFVPGVQELANLVDYEPRRVRIITLRNSHEGIHKS
jgi:hypothetical protein